MYYILNFENHQFVSCDNASSAEANIRKLLAGGVNKDFLEIVNGFSEDIRMQVAEFRSFCKDYNLVDEGSVHVLMNANSFEVSFRKCFSDYNISSMMDELARNAWDGKGPTELTLIAGDNVIKLQGYTYEPSYECFSTTASISLNGKVFYGIDSRTVEAYRCETYHTGVYENLEDAISAIKVVVQDSPCVLKEKTPKMTHEDITPLGFGLPQCYENKDSRAVACNGVPIFDGHGGILSTDDAIHLENMWEKSENYKRNHSSIPNNSSKVPLEQQLQFASSRAVEAHSSDKSLVKKSTPER